MKWSELTEAQKQMIRDLRRDGWSLDEAITQALATS